MKPTTVRQRPTLAEPVRADSLYSAKQLMSALGWSWRALWEAQKRGLRVVKFRSKSYVSGADVLRFFAELPAAQVNGKAKAGGETR